MNLSRFRPTLTLALTCIGTSFAFAQSPSDQGLAPLASSRAMFFWGDYDADGIEDALAITPDHKLHLLRNAGDGTFEDATQLAGLDAIENANIAVWKDYDQDGQLDLFVGTSSGASHLLHNLEGAFYDVTSECGIDASGLDRSAHWIDYDEDGLLDLHLISGSENVFFHAKADGSFERVALPDVYMAPVAGSNLTIGAPLQGASVSSSEAEAANAGSSRAVSRGLSSSSNRVSVGSDIDPSGGGSQSLSSLPPPTVSGICAHSLKDMSGGCLKANSSATLGMLYPLSDKFFVEESTGRVGIGTTTPTSLLSVAGSADFDGKVGIGIDGPLPFSFFFDVNSDQNYGLRVFNFSGPLVGAWYNDGASPGCKIRYSGLGGPFWEVGQDPDGSYEVQNGSGALPNPMIKITPSSSTEYGNFGIGVADPGARLHVNGMVRAGSETGTSQAPDTAYNYEGMVTRRIASTVTSAGSVVARSQFMRLERDGSNGVMNLAWDAGALNDQVVYGTALTNGGTVIPIVFNFGGPATAGSQALYTATDVVRLDIAFGSTFNIRELTEVTLVRTNSDFWWVGSLTSSWDQ